MSDTLPSADRRDIEGPSHLYGNSNEYGKRAETDAILREDQSDKSEDEQAEESPEVVTFVLKRLAQLLSNRGEGAYSSGQSEESFGERPSDPRITDTQMTQMSSNQNATQGAHLKSAEYAEDLKRRITSGKAAY